MLDSRKSSTPPSQRLNARTCANSSSGSSRRRFSMVTPVLGNIKVASIPCLSIMAMRALGSDAYESSISGSSAGTIPA